MQPKTTYKTTKDVLINTQVPLESRTYKPLIHEQVIDLTLSSIGSAGFTLDKEEYSMAKGGNVAIGKYTIKNIMDKEMQLQISWLNSYDKSKRLTWGIGAQVIICMNGMISADMGSFKKKHQGEIQEFTPKAITEYVKRASFTFEEIQREREEMKKIELSERVRAELIGRMFIEEDIIASTQLNVIKNQLIHPEFDYNCPNSLYELYQFTTQGMKELHPSLYMEKHMNAHKFFVNEAGILVKSNSVNIPLDISPNQQVIQFENI